MTFDEYKFIQPKQEDSVSEDSISEDKAITSKEDYLETMKAVHAYRNNPVGFEWTKEDFDLFQKSYDQLIDVLTTQFNDDEDCDLDKIIKYMAESDWKWIGKTVTRQMFLDAIWEKFERCMQWPGPTYSVTTGGITLSTDIEDHSIHFYFGSYNYMAYPDEVC